jgi:hypothetical protein
MMESSWLAICLQAAAGDDGWTLEEPPKIVRAHPPRAFDSWYRRSRSVGRPSSAMASAWPEE